MSLNGVIARFATATSYTVTRVAAGSTTAGRYTAGASSSVTIVGSVQPVTGRLLKVLAEGQRADEARVLYTTTQLFTRTPTNEPDRVTIDSELWEVFRVDRWQHFGETHYIVMLSRKVVP